MRVAFRADASLQIGSGHVMRCLTLANSLRESGANCVFVCRDHAGNLLNLIRQRGFDAIGLPLPDVAAFGSRTPSTRLAHADWLGDSWQRDAEQTLAALNGKLVDWLVVDHYALDFAWEDVLRPAYRRLLVIDDLADRNHRSDLLLDQNLVEQMAERYHDRVPSSCRQLLGPRFALLQPQYAALHARVPPREGAVRCALAYFGGADNLNLTGKTISAFLALGRKDVRLDVVINPDGIHTRAIREQVRGLEHIHLHSSLPSLSNLIMRADIAIGAGGATSWERCCLGLPSLIVTLADNQVPIAAELQVRGLARWLGHAHEVGEDQLRDALRIELERGVDAACSARCHAAVDGHGAQRVAAAMLLSQSVKLCARGATLNDEEPCLELLAAASPSANHRECYRAWLRDPETFLPTIIESDSGYLVALVVFNFRRSTIRQSLAIDPFAHALALREGVMAAALRYLKKVTDGPIRLSGAPAELASPVSDADGAVSDFGGLCISICSDAGSWINDSIPGLLYCWLVSGHEVSWVSNADELPGGDLCFFLSYGRIVGSEIRSRYRNCLVVHESNLPVGRGWAPMSWQILEGAASIFVTLIEAADDVDAGNIYLQEKIALQGGELNPEWRALQAESTFRLCREFVGRYPAVLSQARQQSGASTFYSRRRAADSELDPNKSIAQQFGLLRIVNNDEYPAFFELNGKRYVMRIEKLETE